MIDPHALGLVVTGKVDEHEVQCLCPYHEDSSPSAEFNTDKGLFWCFTCKTSKRASEVADDLGGFVSHVAHLSAEPLTLGDELTWTNYLKGSLALDHEYLLRRRVTNDQVRAHGLLSHPQGIVFPIPDKFNRLTGIQIRHTSRKPKYKIQGKRQPLWPMTALYLPGDLFVTEGVFGVLRAERAGLSAVAMMGSGHVAEVAPFLRTRMRMGSQTGVVMDNDFAGLLAAGKFVLMDIPAIITDIPADEMTPKQWRRAIKSQVVYDVNQVIAASDEPERLQSRLEKFWRKLSYE